MGVHLRGVNIPMHELRRQETDRRSSAVAWILEEVKVGLTSIHVGQIVLFTGSSRLTLFPCARCDDEGKDCTF